MDQKPVIDLTWEGPFSFFDLLADVTIKTRFSKPGVYLWVVHQPSGTKKIIYIGKASGRPDLVKRHIEHYRYYISGAYLIPPWARKSNTRWDADWKKNPNVIETLFDKEKLCSFVGETFDYVSLIRIYLAPISATDLPNLALIEKTMIYDVQPEENDIGKQSRPDSMMQIRDLGATEWKHLAPSKTS